MGSYLCYEMVVVFSRHCLLSCLLYFFLLLLFLSSEVSQEPMLVWNSLFSRSALGKVLSIFEESHYKIMIFSIYLANSKPPRHPSVCIRMVTGQDFLGNGRGLMGGSGKREAMKGVKAQCGQSISCF